MLLPALGVSIHLEVVAVVTVAAGIVGGHAHVVTNAVDLLLAASSRSTIALPAVMSAVMGSAPSRSITERSGIMERKIVCWRSRRNKDSSNCIQGP
jgi:hypothetical protein